MTQKDPRQIQAELAMPFAPEDLEKLILNLEMERHTLVDQEAVLETIQKFRAMEALEQEQLRLVMEVALETQVAGQMEATEQVVY